MNDSQVMALMVAVLLAGRRDEDYSYEETFEEAFEEATTIFIDVLDHLAVLQKKVKR